MYITELDHLVLTVKDIQATIRFYTTVLGMEEVVFAGSRHALCFGQLKINLHQQGDLIEPHAAHPAPGTADLCFITGIPMEQTIEHLQSCGVDIIHGPLQRTGAAGPLLSVYIRDPDNNLIEIANRVIKCR
jgi:catechol 2,3-dioxygenase-like lactoylglutathione lyase family enzyme